MVDEIKMGWWDDNIISQSLIFLWSHHPPSHLLIIHHLTIHHLISLSYFLIDPTPSSNRESITTSKNRRGYVILSWDEDGKKLWDRYDMVMVSCEMNWSTIIFLSLTQKHISWVQIFHLEQKKTIKLVSSSTMSYDDICLTIYHHSTLIWKDWAHMRKVRDRRWEEVHPTQMCDLPPTPPCHHKIYRYIIMWIKWSNLTVINGWSCPLSSTN